MIIAVDGPAASGKGTLAKRLAAHFGLPVLDTGLLYRAVGQRLRDDGHPLDDGAVATAIAMRFEPAWLEDDRLRRREAGEAASRVAKVDGVRRALRTFQQDFAHQPGGAVLDGRDIGTVIAPDATAKLWIDADVAIRAGRRYRELASRGEPVTEAGILADLVERDARDAPNMQIAPDAVRIDTSALDAEAAFARALAEVLAVLAGAGQSRG
ncbi:MAG: (d)CMP kinase [Beijerinckiaceae bacterium]|nr:(d)CMP kinase [Beijerinckiaceae bacterium]MCZ8298977.1 (d)CMP kinase [Beijerinckiaceae bacterium]